MPNPEHLRFYVPSNSDLQRQFIKIFQDSPTAMRRGRDATYALLSKTFFWNGQSKHVKNWIRRCQACIKFKSNMPADGPMHLRSYKYPFYTLGIDFVGELPISPNNHKWLLTCVCPFSNYLISIPLPDKTATTTANALFNHVFLKYGFPEILQSDRGGEFLNAVLHRLVKLLSIKHVFTTAYRPRMNGSTERVHRWINSALGIFSENHQNDWEQFIQPATYAHNISPIPGSEELSPFFLLFGRDALSPDTIPLQLPKENVSADLYASHLLHRLKSARTEYEQIKDDLKRSQREYYDAQ